MPFSGLGESEPSTPTFSLLIMYVMLPAASRSWSFDSPHHRTWNCLELWAKINLLLCLSCCDHDIAKINKVPWCPLSTYKSKFYCLWSYFTHTEVLFLFLFFTLYQTNLAIGCETWKTAFAAIDNRSLEVNYYDPSLPEQHWLALWFAHTSHMTMGCEASAKYDQTSQLQLLSFHQLQDCRKSWHEMWKTILCRTAGTDVCFLNSCLIYLDVNSCHFFLKNKTEMQSQCSTPVAISSHCRSFLLSEKTKLTTWPSQITSINTKCGDLGKKCPLPTQDSGVWTLGTSRWCYVGPLWNL